MIKHCVICGASFSAPPSSKKITCSPACRSKRAAKSARCARRKWSAEAKARRAEDPKIKAQMSGIQLIGSAAAMSKPDSRRGVEHRASKVWTLIDPAGNKIVVTNLLDWARKNYTLFDPGCDDAEAAANRVAKGFRAIASSMRGVHSRERAVNHYKGWSLSELPTEKPNKSKNEE